MCDCRLKVPNCESWVSIVFFFPAVNKSFQTVKLLIAIPVVLPQQNAIFFTSHENLIQSPNQLNSC